MWIALLVVVVPLGWLLVSAAGKPDQFQVQRRAVIKAPPERIFPLLADFHRWGEWSPWDKLDPAMKRDFGGPPSGLGSTYAWSGNRKAGQGRMEMVEVIAPTRLVIALHFTAPFTADNTTELALTPGAEGTELRWTMSGGSPFLMKVMGHFMNLDRAIGRDFETGLGAIKALAERA